MRTVQIIDLEDLLDTMTNLLRTRSLWSKPFLWWRTIVFYETSSHSSPLFYNGDIMLKKIYTNIGDYYFDSEKFTLSTSSVEGTTSYKPPYIPKNVLQKIVINISNSCNLSCSYCYADGGNYWHG